MQRDDRNIVKRQLLRFLQDLLSRRIIGSAKCLINQLVELRIGIAPTVGCPPSSRRIEGGILRNKRIRCLGCSSTPTKQERGKRLLISLPDIARPRQWVDLGLHTDAR